MKLFTDEDTGVGIPTALQAIGLDATSMIQQDWRGTTDTEWLNRVGERNWLALSCNKRMLFIPAEVEAIYSSNIAILFVTTGEEKTPVLLMALLRRWKEIEDLFLTAPRPLVRFLPLRGRLLTEYRQYKLPPRGT